MSTEKSPVVPVEQCFVVRRALGVLLSALSYSLSWPCPQCNIEGGSSFRTPVCSIQYPGDETGHFSWLPFEEGQKSIQKPLANFPLFLLALIKLCAYFCISPSVQDYEVFLIQVCRACEVLLSLYLDLWASHQWGDMVTLRPVRLLLKWFLRPPLLKLMNCVEEMESEWGQKE